MVILSVITASHYGDSWDEDIRMREGEKKLAYYSNLIRGDIDAAQDIGKVRDKYPGFHDLNLAVLRRISPLPDRLTGNLFSVLFGLLTMWGTYRFCHEISNDRAAFFSLMLLATMPAFYGHMFINPKDIPFACGYIWALLFISRWLRGNGVPTWRLAIITGIAIGITMATRVGGLVLFCYLGFFAFTYILFAHLRQRRDPLLGKHFFAVSLRIAAAGILAMAILLVYWPYGQLAPFANTGKTIEAISGFSWNMPVFFEGQYINAYDLPRYYILKMLLYKVPLITLVSFFAGLVIVVHRSVKAVSSTSTLPFTHLLILLSILFPFAYVIARDSTLYNGLRHLLFTLPPLCIIAAITIDDLLGWLMRYRRRLLIPAAAIIFGYPLATGMNMIQLHPYQYIYYNELAGGTAAASRHYETDYWCTVYKELGELFLDYLRTNRPQFSRPEVVVNMEHPTWLLRPFIPQGTSLPIRVVRSSPREDDYYISSTSWAANQYYLGTSIIEVNRQGVNLGVIKDRRNLVPSSKSLQGSPQP